MSWTGSVEWFRHLPELNRLLTMTKLSAVNNYNEKISLNEKPTLFELLELRNGAVGLMGHNMVPQGDYAFFELTLGTKQEIQIDGQFLPLTIEDAGQSVLRFMGPFALRGGRLTEVFLDFDPNTSIFYIPERGYILDPTLLTTSVISMTPVQDGRIRDALGQRSNTVTSESDLIFQGTVKSVSPFVSQNIYGKNTVYSQNTLTVEDRLRGQVSTPEFSIQTPGGTVNSSTLKVKGMPEFTAGESCLVFLKKYGNRYAPTRGEMGKISF